MSDTKEALLDAAERLFAEQGVSGASLRAITGAAGVNLAAVNYHFGSKEGLVEAVFSRRLEPVNRQRLGLLDACEARGGKPVLEAVLRAFIAPPLRAGADLPDRGRHFKRLIGRVFSEPGGEAREILMGQFAEVVERFTTALGRTLPELPREVVMWRLHFAVGALTHLATNAEVVERYAEGLCRVDDVEAMIDQVVTYTAGGFRAPLPHPVEEVTRPELEDDAP